MTLLWNGDSLFFVVFTVLVWVVLEFIEFEGFKVANDFLFFSIRNLQVALFVSS